MYYTIFKLKMFLKLLYFLNWPKKLLSEISFKYFNQILLILSAKKYQNFGYFLLFLSIIILSQLQILNNQSQIETNQIQIVNSIYCCNSKFNKK